MQGIDQFPLSPETTQKYFQFSCSSQPFHLKMHTEAFPETQVYHG